MSGPSENVHEVFLMLLARDSAISMPYRIQQIEEFVKQLEAGDFKLWVQVLEVSPLYCFQDLDP